jgi:hypothetical protein
MAYFLVELLLGLVLIIIAFKSILPTLLIQLLVGGVYAVLLIPSLLANEYTAVSEEERQIEIDYIKKATGMARGILSAVNDRELKRAVEKLADELASSPTKSHPDLQPLESDIVSCINLLSSNLNDIGFALQTADKTLHMLKDRNHRLKAIQ